MTIGRDGLGYQDEKRGSGGKFDVNNRKFGATMRQICLDLRQNLSSLQGKR